MESALRSMLANKLAEYYNQSQIISTQNVPYISYGTAGFRGNAITIEHLFFKVGLVAGLICLKEQQNIGVMITASHNPIDDNGVKIINSKGEMLSSEWENIIEKFCNTPGQEQILQQMDDIVVKYNIKTGNTSDSRVLIGFDTRPSSQTLVRLVKQGIDSFGTSVKYHDYGLLTTPALHYLVGVSNVRNQLLSIEDYYNQLVTGIEEIFNGSPKSNDSYSPEQLVIDCANGVGVETMKNLIVNEKFSRFLKIQLVNTGDGILNANCGADFVKTTHQPPSNVTDTSKRYASLDGDADRVVYYYLETNCSNNQVKLHLLDGDKIMALFAYYMKDVLKRSDLDQILSLGIIQTAYANGASTQYMASELGLQVDFADTGVKNLHKKAIKYDFGIYFEANGHGTIWISPKAKELVKRKNIVELIRLFAIINNYTGDAISDILLVETILRFYDWDIKSWHRLYRDRPNSLIKVQVKDRNVVKTTNAGQTCTEPIGLQAKIDGLVEPFGQEARSFVRPSGTENVVRIYAEAANQDQADKLAQLVGEETKKMCDSI